MVKILDVDLIKGHFIVTDNGKRALIDTGCPVDINEKNMQRIPGLRQHLEGARGHRVHRNDGDRRRLRL